MLLAAVLLPGPTVRLPELFGEATTDYLVSIPTLSLWSNAFGAPDWQQQWTLFQWAWWISWPPFVGMFIAWISRGRSMRLHRQRLQIRGTIPTFRKDAKNRQV